MQARAARPSPALDHGGAIRRAARCSRARRASLYGVSGTCAKWGGRMGHRSEREWRVLPAASLRGHASRAPAPEGVRWCTQRVGAGTGVGRA
eukprot:7284747-Prymnesium_polylepis.1